MDVPLVLSCPGCEALSREIAALKQEVARLAAQLAAAQKNSSNSSKPPSSDIVKPPPAKPKSGTAGKRKRGAQPGHKRHVRPLAPPEEVDQFFEHRLDVCPDCGGKTRPLDEPPRRLQQVELVPQPTVLIEHQAHACFCKRCNKTHYAPFPKPVARAGLFGPELTALVAFLKGGCHCSFSTIRKFLRDVAKVTVSRGFLRKLCAKMSDSLDAAYEQLLESLPKENVANVDETGLKEYRRRLWVWCFRAASYTLFKIDPSRGSDVLVEVLGKESRGVLGCDYYSAYRKYMKDFNAVVQFCLAHLLRDIKFLAEHPDRRNRAYGRRVLNAAREMFRVIHDRDELGSDFRVALIDAGEELQAQAEHRVPATKEAQNLANRFRRHGESYLRFITTPGIDPTNNAAEQAIRFVVIDRLVTQGPKCEGGRRWLERIWTTMATCAQHGKSAFEFLVETVTAHFAGRPTPSLLPDTT
jgi:transposase